MLVLTPGTCQENFNHGYNRWGHSTTSYPSPSQGRGWSESLPRPDHSRAKQLRLPVLVILMYYGYNVAQ
jgi:hypothetical protein